MCILTFRSKIYGIYIPATAVSKVSVWVQGNICLPREIHGKVLRCWDSPNYIPNTMVFWAYQTAQQRSRLVAPLYSFFMLISCFALKTLLIPLITSKIIISMNKSITPPPSKLGSWFCRIFLVRDLQESLRWWTNPHQSIIEEACKLP